MTPLYICTLLTPTLSSKTKWYANPTSPPIRRGNRYRSRSNSIQTANNGSEWKDGPCWKKCTVIGLNWSNEMYDNILALRSTLSSDQTQPNPTKSNQTKPNTTHPPKERSSSAWGLHPASFPAQNQKLFCFPNFPPLTPPQVSKKNSNTVKKRKDKINRLLLSIYK